MDGFQHAYEKRYDDFRVKTFKIFGSIQIILVIICTLLSIIAVCFDGKDLSESCDTRWGYNYYRHAYYFAYVDFNSYTYTCWTGRFALLILGFDVTCLICSLWFILTGILPFCMTEAREERWTYLKTSYMVCCIIASVIFIPIVLSLGMGAAVIRSIDSQDTGSDAAIVAMPSILALSSFIEFIVTIAGACYCCCCWKTKTRIYPMSIDETGQPFVILTNSQWQELGMPCQGTAGQTAVPLQGTCYPVMMTHQQNVTQHQHHITQQPMGQSQPIGQLQPIGQQQPMDQYQPMGQQPIGQDQQMGQEPIGHQPMGQEQPQVQQQPMVIEQQAPFSTHIE